MLYYFLLQFLLSPSVTIAAECNEGWYIKDQTIEITRPNATKASTSSVVMNDNKPCVITFRTDEGHKLKVKVAVSEQNVPVVEEDCSETYVFVDNEVASETKKICKNGQTLNFDSSANQVVIAYQDKTAQQRDKSLQGKPQWQFLANIRGVDPQFPCGSFVQEFDGSLKKYHFPVRNAQVEISTTCTYAVKNTKGTKIKVVVNELKLYNADKCKNDYLSLSSDDAQGEENAVKICKLTKSPTQYITGSSRLIFEIKVTNYSMIPLVDLSIESELKSVDETSTTTSSSHSSIPILMEIALMAVLCSWNQAGL